MPTETSQEALEQQNVRLPPRTKRYLDRLAVEHGKTTAQYCADVLIEHVNMQLPELAELLTQAAEVAKAEAVGFMTQNTTDQKDRKPHAATRQSKARTAR